MPFKCSECDSTDVECKAWVKMNDTSSVDYSNLDMDDDCDFYCNNCEKHTTVYKDEHITVE